MAPWLPSLELTHRGECPLSVKSAGTLRWEWRPSVRYSLESATCFHIATTLPFLPLCIFSVLYGSPVHLQLPLFISYLTGTVVLSRELNRSGRKADHLHLAPRFANKWSYTSTPHMCPHGVDRNSCTCTAIHSAVWLNRLAVDRRRSLFVLNFNSDDFFWQDVSYKHR